MNSNYIAGDVILNKLNLVLNDGTKFDISLMYVDIQLCEDMFNNTIKGMLTINDHLDIISTAPLVGGEIIELECYTPQLEDKKHRVNLLFQIYKITDRLRVSGESQVYNIHFATQEYINNEINKISTYLSGNVSDSITKIFIDERYLNSKSQLNIPEFPDSSITIATPYWTPFKIINWLTARSLRKNTRTPDFLFFQTLTRGFNYIPITKLYESGETVLRYGSLGIMSYSDGYDINKDYSTIRSIYIDEQFDIIKKAKSGYYNSRLLTANILTKSLESTNIVQKEYFEKYPHLNKYNPTSNNIQISKNASMYSFINNEYVYNNQRDLNFNEWFLQRINFFAGLNNTYKLNITVPGRFDVGIGRMIVIDFEMIRQHNQDENYYNNIRENSSGKFLVTSVNHTIKAGGRHMMTLEVLTDSLSVKI